MARAAKFFAIGGVTFGGILYGRLYLDVLMAESTVRSIEREVKATATERENLRHEISSSRKALFELETKGTERLKEQSELRQKVDETTSLLSKLKNELLQSKNEFDRLQLKIKETTTRVDRLKLTDIDKQKLIEEAEGRKVNAMQDVVAARKAMEFQNLPLMGPLFSSESSK